MGLAAAAQKSNCAFGAELYSAVAENYSKLAARKEGVAPNALKYWKNVRSEQRKAQPASHAH